ncbi:MAG: hypothetical protein ACYTFG_02135 [Planctomycetota bacterium]|jgi:cytochrome c5
MKWHVAISVAAVLSILVLAQVVKSDREQTAANKVFEDEVRSGEKTYRESCTKCHEFYDPRFFVYDEWTRILAQGGCPRVQVHLTEDRAKSISDFLRAKGAPTDDEAQTVRSRERARFMTERVRKGDALYRERCVRCHRHPYFTKIRTMQGWREVVYDLGSFHPGVNEPVWVDPEGEEADLLAFMGSRAAGTPSDAAAIAKLLESNESGAGVDVEADVPHEIVWVRDYEKGMLEALKSKKPVILDLTDLSGG